MTRHLEISPYLAQPLRSLQQVERARGIVRTLSEEERVDIIRGAEEFTCELRNTDGAPLDMRVHLRRFFELLREQLRICGGDLTKALSEVDYSELPAERGYWEACGRAERRNVVQYMADWRASR